MDAPRFDSLVRSLQRLAPRRAALGALGGGLAGFLGRLAPDEAEARAKARGKGQGKNKNKNKKRRRKKKKCKKGFTCGSGTKPCKKSCIPSETCCGGCGDQQCCDAACISLTTDAGNCGACGHRCKHDLCHHGACSCTPGPQDDCPLGCLCGVRLEGGDACTSSVNNGADCSGDADCPLGSFCFANGHCSTPCLA